MEIEACMQLAPALKSARARAGLQQKWVAAEAGLDQSYLCALERGRKAVPSSEVLKALSRALGLKLEERQQLDWAATHDRVLSLLKREGQSRGASLVSAALQALNHLSDAERQGVERNILKSLASKAHLTALLASSRSLDDGEDAMS